MLMKIENLIETNITLHANTTLTSQHDSIDDENKSPLHDIAYIKGFKIAGININSLHKHIDEIRYLLMSGPLEVLAVNNPNSIILLQMEKCISLVML